MSINYVKRVCIVMSGYIHTYIYIYVYIFVCISFGKLIVLLDFAKTLFPPSDTL